MTKSARNRDVVEDVSIHAVSAAKILHIGEKGPVLEEGGKLVGLLVRFTVKVTNVDCKFSGMEMRSVWYR